jgi:hypothetical protein
MRQRTAFAALGQRNWQRKRPFERQIATPPIFGMETKWKPRVTLQCKYVGRETSLSGFLQGISPLELLDTRVELTMFRGKVVFQR